MFLSAYNYTIEYVRSADNNADFLSRASLRYEQSRASAEGEGGAHAAAAAALIDRASYVHFVVEGSLPVSLDELRDATDNDVTLKKVVNLVHNGWPRKIVDIRIKPYYLCKTQLSYENGCLMRGHKVVLPEVLRDKVLKELHNSHLGIVKTKAEVRSRFWYPGIDEAVEMMINSCDICKLLRPSPPRAPLAPWKYPPTPFHRLHIDFLGPINNNLMFLVVVDAHTKWVEIYDVSNSTTSATVTDKLYDFMSKYGLPHTIVSDNGTAFTSFEFKNFCSLNGINHLTSPAYNPASNGQAESFVKIVKKGIKSSILSSQSKRDCKLKLLKYLFDYRNSLHSVTGFSPAELVFGRKLRTRLDVLNPTPPPPPLTSLVNNVKRKQCSQIKFSGGNNRQVFKPGDEILYKKYLHKNKYQWCMGVVIKRLGSVLYLIKDSVTSTNERKHKNQMVINIREPHYCNIEDDDITAGVYEPQPQMGEEGIAGNSQGTPISRCPHRLLRNVPRVDYAPYL